MLRLLFLAFRSRLLPLLCASLPLLLVFLGVGVLVGVFGGLTAIRNYLKG